MLAHGTQPRKLHPPSHELVARVVGVYHGVCWRSSSSNPRCFCRSASADHRWRLLRFQVWLVVRWLARGARTLTVGRSHAVVGGCCAQGWRRQRCVHQATHRGTAIVWPVRRRHGFDDLAQRARFVQVNRPWLHPWLLLRQLLHHVVRPQGPTTVLQLSRVCGGGWQAA